MIVTSSRLWRRLERAKREGEVRRVVALTVLSGPDAGRRLAL